MGGLARMLFQLEPQVAEPCQPPCSDRGLLADMFIPGSSFRSKEQGMVIKEKKKS
jgi:hypothetical protein